MIIARYNPSSPIYIRYLFYSEDVMGWDLTGRLDEASRFSDIEHAREAIRRFCQRTELLPSNCEIVQLEFKVIEKGSI